MPANYTGLPYTTIWAVDFEFRCPGGNPPTAVCMVAKELRNGAIIRLGDEDLYRRDRCPFNTGKDSLVITYYGTAEASCFLALGWDLPVNHLDLFVEFRNHTNGHKDHKQCGLIAALRYFGLSSISDTEKDSLRDLIITNESYTEKQKLDILDYCQSDVVALERLLPAMLSGIDLKRALLRRRHMMIAAIIERNGISIDAELHLQLHENRMAIRDKLIRRIDAEYNVYTGGSFRTEKFVAYLARNKISWPYTDSGMPKLDDDTFKERALLHPQLENLRQLRKILNILKEFELPLGNDNRVHCPVRPFAAKTGRNQPSTTQFPFGLPSCLRSLIKPSEGMGLAYIDWKQQEFAIAATLSGDEKMIEAYMADDPYMVFGRQAGLLPPDATRQSHEKERARIKQSVLAVQYCMGPYTLAGKLDCIPLEALDLLEIHKRTYKRFWEWIETVMDNAYLDLKIATVFGWQFTIGCHANPRAVQNFTMQANGSEILRLSSCFANDDGIKVCALVHDALLIEAPLEKLYEDAAATHAAMRRAGEIVLGGFALKTDVELICYPDHYESGKGKELWDIIYQELKGEVN